MGRTERRKPLISSIKTLGDWIRAHRLAKNLAPSHLAAKMGITHAIIRLWEGGTSQPCKQYIDALVEIFGERPPEGIA